MGCFISRKKDKVAVVFKRVGSDADEETFIAAFKKLYPNDWLKINERWQLEEKLMAEEGLKKTDNKLIHIGCPIPFDVDVFLDQLGKLMTASYANKKDIRDRVEAIVSTYHPTGSTTVEVL